MFSQLYMSWEDTALKYYSPVCLLTRKHYLRPGVTVVYRSSSLFGFPHLLLILFIIILNRKKEKLGRATGLTWFFERILIKNEIATTFLIYIL